MPREPVEGRDRLRVTRRRAMRMDAHRHAHEVRMGARDVERALAGRDVLTAGEDPLDASGRGPRDDGIAVCVEARVREMRVRVDHATRVRRPLRARELEAREEAFPGTYRGPGGERAPARRLVPSDGVRAWLSETLGDQLGHAGR